MKSVFKHVKTLIGALLAGLLVASILLAGQAHVAYASSNAAPGVATNNISAGAQREALAFWTHQRITNAQPFSMPTDSGAGGAGAAELPDAISGLGASAPAGQAAANSNAIARQAFAADWQAAGAASLADSTADETAGTSQVYTSYIANSWAPAQTIYPHKWIGRLSFNTVGGTSYCSATSISGNNFVTAAHCVYDTTNNVWYSGWVFAPAYRNGSAPYGTFAATACTILTSWITLSGSFSINSWTKYDVAVCTVGKNAAAQTLNAAVGWAGRQWNYGYVRNFFDLGYPWQDTNLTNLANAGQYLRLCTAESFMQTTDTLGMGCNYGPGISGGPWMIGYYPSAVAGAVNSVNSGLFIGQANLYGIRFTSSNIVPVCTARAC